MRRAISTYCYVHQRLHPGVLDQLAQAGAEDFELFGARNHFDYHDRAHVKEIAAWFRENGRELHSMHSPLIFGTAWGSSGQPTVNIVAGQRPARIDAMDEVKRAIEVAEQLPFRFLVQHIGDTNESFDQRKFDDAMTAIEHLKAFAKPLGVSILIENIPNELATPEKIVELIKTAHFKDVGVCFDTGHANLYNRQYHKGDGVEQAFELLKPLIRSTHVHDNDGDKDDHLLPGAGTIDWKKTMDLLASAPQNPPLLLEIKGDDGAPIAKQASDAYRKLLG